MEASRFLEVRTYATRANLYSTYTDGVEFWLSIRSYSVLRAATLRHSLRQPLLLRSLLSTRLSFSHIMVGGCLRCFHVPGCFRPHSRSQQSIPPVSEEEIIEGELEFYSPRIAEMMVQLRSNPGMDQLQSEVEASRVTWSELSSTSVIGEALAAENSRVFKSLQEQWPSGKYGGFFEDWNEEDWEVGEKIAEGGQAELFALRRRTPAERHADNNPGVVKMFKEGLSLQDLQRLLPRSMLEHKMTRESGYFFGGIYCNSIHGAMLINGRFALRMARLWGDLRKLIDARMIHNLMQSAPFTDKETTQCMLHIADGMKALHLRKVTHGDLKAANVLLGKAFGFDLLRDRFSIAVADYECSVGVVGTGFWRAPEILLAVKNKNVTQELFTYAADMYSYAMTCYEVLTGRIPFELEGLKLNEYDRVIGGYRPALPRQTPQWMRTLLDRCWHSDPLERPTFKEVVDILEEEKKKKKMEKKRTFG